MTILYQTFGWSIRLIAGTFSSTTHYIMHNVHKVKYGKIITIDEETTLSLFHIKNIQSK